MPRVRWSLVVVAEVICACSCFRTPPDLDAGNPLPQLPDASAADASMDDAGAPDGGGILADAGVEADAGLDAGGSVADAGRLDGGAPYACAVGSTMPSIVFPPDAGLVDVGLPPFNALPNDGLDDTAGIQLALDNHPTGNHLFYFRPGVYEVSATLRPAISSGVTKRNILQGAGRDQTTIKLKDGLAFTNAVIDFRAGPAQFFRNAVRDLTIDIGSGNPNASGLKFNASNQGTVANVRIRAPEREGNVGLDLAHSGEIGPLLVRDVVIENFGLGVWSRFQTASQTFENLTLVAQREAGMLVSSAQDVFIRNLVSRNAVPAIVNGPLAGRDSTGEGSVVLLGAQLINPTASGGPAIRNQKAMFLQDILAVGYERIVNRELVAGRGNENESESSLYEYWANGVTADRRGGAVSAFETNDVTLRLPVLETPEIPLSELSRWAGPHQFGGVASDGADDTMAIQQAIDSGAETVFLPRGAWEISGTLVIRGNVRRLLGTEAQIVGQGSIRLEEGPPCAVVIERLEQPPGNRVIVQHASARALILQHALFAEYTPVVAAPGRVFIRDVVMGKATFRNQEVWARQFNLEGSPATTGAPRILNDNARVWVLGMKTEDNGTDVRTINGGQTELYGALHVGSLGTAQRLETVDSLAVGVAIRGGVRTATETRGGETRTVDFDQSDFYTALSTERLGQEGVVFVDNSDTARFSTTGVWTPTVALPGGFTGVDALFTKDATATATFALRVPTAGSYEVFVRWMVDRSGQDHSGHSTMVPYVLTHASGTTNFTLNHAQGGGDFVSLGRFTFEPTRLASLVVRGMPQGAVIADSVLLRRR